MEGPLSIGNSALSWRGGEAARHRFFVPSSLADRGCQRTQDLRFHAVSAQSRTSHPSGSSDCRPTSVRPRLGAQHAPEDHWFPTASNCTVTESLVHSPAGKTCPIALCVCLDSRRWPLGPTVCSNPSWLAARASPAPLPTSALRQTCRYSDLVVVPTPRRAHSSGADLVTQMLSSHRSPPDLS